MFKKSDTWENGIKMVSKFLGFDIEQDNDTSKPTQCNNGLLSLKSNSQTPVFYKSQQKSFQLKQKWRKLMKFPSKVKYSETLELLKQGSAIQDQTWIWMLKNTQKISSQLYTSKKQHLHKIIYPKHPALIRQDFTDLNFQIQDFQQPNQFKMSVKQSIGQPKKRKISISKSGIFNKNQNNPPTQRLSINSQASTFSSQTHNSNDGIMPGSQWSQQTILLDKMLCSKYSETSSPSKKSWMKNSLMSVCSYAELSPPPHTDIGSPVHQKNYMRPYEFNPASLTFEQSLHQLPAKINHQALTDIIGSFLLHRQDFSYSVTLFNMAATFYYYTNSNQIKTFIMLNHVACSQFFIPYLTKDFQQSANILHYITNKIRQNCPSSAFLKYFKLQNFIQNWLYGFFYSVCQNGTQLKQKIIGYLLINNFSIDSLAKLCQSLIFSLRKVINQGYQDRIYQCLQNPKFFIDKEVLYENLFQSVQ